MPTPFMCHECDSPTMNVSGVCDDCQKEMEKKMVSSTRIGTKMNLPSDKDGQEQDTE
jgi:predicted amidophosphoribosyltransferase